MLDEERNNQPDHTPADAIPVADAPETASMAEELPADALQTDQLLEDAPLEDAVPEDAIPEDAQLEADTDDELPEPGDVPEEEALVPAAPTRDYRAIFRKCGRIAFNVLPVLLFVLAAALVVYYIIFPSRGEFHSDCTDTIYWANASYESGHIFNEDFGYACLLPFGGSLLMQIFMPFFGLSMTTHILGMLLFFVLFTLFFCLMLREMHWNYRYICGAAAILLTSLCASQKMREIFWGHTIYYSLSILFLFIGLFLLFRMRNLEIRRRECQLDSSRRNLTIQYCVILGIFLLFFLLASTNRISSLTIFGLPLLAAIFAEALVDTSVPVASRRNLKTLVLLACMCVMLVLGIKLCNWWAGDIVAGYESAYSNFTDTGEWLEHTQNLPLAWLQLFGLENLPGEKLTSVESIKNLLHLFTGILIAVIPVIATICYPKYKGNTGRQMHVCIWVHWAVTALILVGWICGSLSAANWRLTPVICTSTVVTLLFVHWAIAEKTSMARISSILMIPVVAACVLNGWNVAKMPHDNYKDSDLYQLVDYLDENNLTYGYATFWNANAMTVISDDIIRVRNINVANTGVEKNPYQSDLSWYEDQEGQDNYFLLLNQGENDTLINGGAEILTRASWSQQVQTTSGSIFYIYVYSENIF